MDQYRLYTREKTGGKKMEKGTQTRWGTQEDFRRVLYVSVYVFVCVVRVYVFVCVHVCAHIIAIGIASLVESVPTSLTEKSGRGSEERKRMLTGAEMTRQETWNTRRIYTYPVARGGDKNAERKLKMTRFRIVFPPETERKKKRRDSGGRERERAEGRRIGWKRDVIRAARD